MTTPVDTVRRFYDALGRGDVSAVLSLLDAQVAWTEAERFPYYGGTWRGRRPSSTTFSSSFPATGTGFPPSRASSSPRVTALFRSEPIPALNSLLAGNLDAETGSHRTASSVSQSGL
jgi:hypothetical protein